ncbi:MAG: hypothetical protein GY906_27370 [bacterium]|nr:hypothetical protein [bacterium]
MNEQAGRDSEAPQPCDQCGVANRPGISFCGGCGALISDPLKLNRDELFRRPMLITTLAATHFVFGALMILLGTLVMLQGSRIPAAPVFVLALIGIGLGHLVCGRDLWKVRPGGRVGAMVFAGLWLIAFPIGTVVGAAVLVYLTRPLMRLLFSGLQPEAMAAEDVARLHIASKTGSSGGIAAVVTVAAVLMLAIPTTGIIAAIAIPNILNSINQGRCSRAVDDLRSISDAIDTYHRGTLPIGVETIDDLQSELPENVVLPTHDGWGRPYIVESVEDGYRVFSYGRDGKPGPEPPNESFDSDLVIENRLNMLDRPASE